VIWHEPTGKWVAVLYVEMPGRKHTIQFFTSPNLRKWTPASLLEGDTNPGKFLYECPDLFELAVDGDPANRKWVLMAADSAYAIGSFDGLLFKPEQSRLVGHRGRGFYAAQTFSDIPAKDGRRIQIGWFQTETRDMPFNQSMTLPLELRLTGTREGPRLTWAPVNELHTLRQRTFTLAPGLLTPESPDRLAGFEGELLEFRGDFTPGKGSELLLSIRGARISYDAGRQELRVNDHAVPAPLRAGRQQIVVYCDRTGLEVFASGGLTYVPMPFQPKTDDRRVGVSVRGGNVEVNSLQVHQLNSIWK
jgi:sucrose-6-phosphate hydrolase SacC (GH32 family)